MFFFQNPPPLTLHELSEACDTRLVDVADIVNHHKGGCGIHLLNNPVLSNPESIEETKPGPSIFFK